MRPELFSIGPFHVYSYGLMIALGIILALGDAQRRAKKFGVDPDHIFNLGFLCAVVGIAGAKIMYVITEIPRIIENPSIFGSLLLSEGFVVYGGIILGILFAKLYCGWKKINFTQAFDIVMPSVALAQGFGRIGCFLAGCCYGRATDAWYGVTFSASSFAPAGVSVIPTQLISSGLDFINFIVLSLFAGKAKPGQVSSLYLLNYSVGRFLIEFLRNDPRGNVGILSTSQFISIFIFVIGVILMVRASKKEPVSS